MKKVKSLSLMAMAALAYAAPAIAQENLESTVSASFVNQYIWRGLDLGNVALQPTFGIAYKGVSLTAWGSVGLANASDTKEFDLTLAYSNSGFNVGITDYWFNIGLDPMNRYFKYDAHGTNHIFEANAGYDFNIVNLQAYVNFTGNDGLNKSGNRAYSTYLELSAPFKLAFCDGLATLGAVPMATSFYGTSGFSVTNISLKATKDIKITNSFSLPIFAQLTANPCSQKAYFVFGFTLQP